MINEILEMKVPKDESDSFLLTYIRQSVINYGVESKKYLEMSGIIIDDESLKKIEKSLESIVVPKEICKKNRYWDPIILNDLYLNKEKFILPTSVGDKANIEKLMNIIKFMEENVQYYYKKYFKIRGNCPSGKLWNICKNANAWLSEIKLRDILKEKYHDDSMKIDETIGEIESLIRYGMSSLLKPLYDIKYPESSFLSFIEMGAYSPVTRAMIEMGIPRETSIYLKETFLNHLVSADRELLEVEILEEIKKNINNFDYWIKIQLSNIMGFQN